MHCPNCNNKVEGGRFCEKCGSPLTGNEGSVTGKAVKTASSPQQNKQLEAAKNISKVYFGYFLSVLKKPYAVSTKVGNEQLINGLITIILFAFFIPLMSYMGLGDYRGWMDSPFLNIVVKPTIGYAVFLLLIATYTFAAIKLGKVNASFKDVITRFGTFLVPFVALFALALVVAILQMDIFVLLLLIGLIGSIFIVPPFVISSFKKDNQNGFDSVYGTLIVYVLTFITTVIMAEVLFSMIERYIGSFLW